MFEAGLAGSAAGGTVAGTDSTGGLAATSSFLVSSCFAGAVAVVAGVALAAAGWVSVLAGSPVASPRASVLKSAGEGGGAFAGSGIGTAASMASSAGEVAGFDCADAPGAAITTRAATAAAMMRSYPPRSLRTSRILEPLMRGCPAGTTLLQNLASIGWFHAVLRGMARTLRDSDHTITQRRPSASAVMPTHAKLTSVLAGLQRFAPICRALCAPLSLPGNGANCGEKVYPAGPAALRRSYSLSAGSACLPSMVSSFRYSVDRPILSLRATSDIWPR